MPVERERAAAAEGHGFQFVTTAKLVRRAQGRVLVHQAGIWDQKLGERPRIFRNPLLVVAATRGAIQR